MRDKFVSKRVKKESLESKSMCETAVAAMEDAKGTDIKVLDVRKLTDITDYMIVATGTSDRHVKTIADRVIEFMLEKEWSPLGMEGEESKDWVLVDFVDIVVHIMRDKARKHFDLESLWDESFVGLTQSNDADSGERLLMR